MRSVVAPGIGARREGGDTLIEILVAVAVMGIAFTVIVGGMGIAIIGASVQQNKTTSDSLIRSAADALGNAGYDRCTPTHDPNYVPALPAAPAGFDPISIVKIGYWDPTAMMGAGAFIYPTAAGTCVDNGLQLVTLSAGATGANIHVPDKETLDVVKREP